MWFCPSGLRSAQGEVRECNWRGLQVYTFSELKPVLNSYYRYRHSIIECWMLKTTKTSIEVEASLKNRTEVNHKARYAQAWQMVVVNETRAIRVAELMDDFHKIQTQIASVSFSSDAEKSNEEGFALMRQCRAQARALLLQPFQINGTACNDEEEKKMHLQHIIADAAVRRFRAWKIYMYLDAALRWAHARDAHLKGEEPDERHVPGLSKLQQLLRAEIGTITDIRVEAECRRTDATQGKWLLEDPPLSYIQSYGGHTG